MIAALTHRVSCSDAIVSLRAQDIVNMQELANIVEQTTAGTNGVVTGVGTIEATMSRIVNVENVEQAIVPTQVPTLVLMEEIKFLSGSQKWTLKYRIMKSWQDILARVMYVSKKEQEVVAGDYQNPRLTRDIELAQCLS